MDRYVRNAQFDTKLVEGPQGGRDQTTGTNLCAWMSRLLQHQRLTRKRWIQAVQEQRGSRAGRAGTNNDYGATIHR